MRPQPIWPTRMRLLAPKARAEMMRGATAAVTRTSRREIPAFSFFMAIASIQIGRDAEYKSLVPQRLDRVEPRCLACRIQPEQHPDACADRERGNHDLAARDHRPAKLLCQQIAQADAEDDTEG